ncbi:MAG: alcohol dehydrogenase catalytic domain-containing protein [Candidatus Limnocylindrales bacterium]
MRAALLVRPGEVVVDDVPEPGVGDGEVRVRVHGVGLCGSDLAVFRGKRVPPAYPWVMGHEAFGDIVEVGRGVDAARVGELVVVEPNIPCGSCEPCGRGWTSGCERRRSMGMNRPGALAEQVVVPNAFAWPVEPRDPEDLVCMEPWTVAETAVRRMAGAVPSAALVMGAGAQGALVTLALQRRGIRVAITDLQEARVAYAAERLGAAPLSPGDDARFDLIVDTTGAPEAVTEAVRRSRVGATIIELGLDPRLFKLDAETIVRRQITLRGSLTYDHPVDFAWAIPLVTTGAVSPGRVISDEHPLVDAQRAFDACATARGKTWIRVLPS